jgi:segregation and condensation protein A
MGSELLKRNHIKFKLDHFEGPLDLLLHLIRKSEVDIFDIPIVEITEQYMNYLDLLKEVDIDLSSEFMLMAATLIHIKTKMLLPKKPDEDDPRMELVERLLEHQQYKAAAMVLGQKEERESKVYYSSKKRVEPFMEIEEEYIKADIFQLIAAFQNVLKSIGKDYEIEVNHQKFTISDKINSLEGMLKAKPRLLFSEVMTGLRSKREIVVTFLALLELVRRRFINTLQHRSFGEIVLIKVDRNQRVLPIS